MLQLNGETIFELKDTHGLPLEIIIDECIARNVTIIWAEFIDAALNHGWNGSQIYRIMKEGLTESLSATDEYTSGVLERTRLYLMVKYA